MEQSLGFSDSIGKELIELLKKLELNKKSRTLTTKKSADGTEKGDDGLYSCEICMKKFKYPSRYDEHTKTNNHIIGLRLMNRINESEELE